MSYGPLRFYSPSEIGITLLKTMAAFISGPMGCSDAPPLEPDGGRRDLGTDSGVDAGTPLPRPQYDSQSVFINEPCGGTSTLRDIDIDVATCADLVGMDHQLVRWDPGRLGFTEAITPSAFLSNPAEVTTIDGGDYWVAEHSGSQLRLVTSNGGASIFVPFPSVSIAGTTSRGTPVTDFIPLNPQGLKETEDFVFVATSNYDESRDDYLPGTIMVVNKATRQYEVIETEGFNPTSLGIYDDMIFVVTTGAQENGQPTTSSQLEVFLSKPPYSHISKLELGRVAAGGVAELPLNNAEQIAVIPTQDDSGRLIIVNINTELGFELTTREITVPIESARKQLTSVQLSDDGRFAFVGNRADGQIYVVELSTGELVGNPILVDNDLMDTASIVDGVTVGGHVFIGLGPDIIRLVFRSE